MTLVLAAGLGALAVPARAQQPTPPAAGPLRPFKMPGAQQFTLRNGVRVLLLERHALPVVSATIAVNAGAAYEPADRAGLATLTAKLLSEGAGDLSGAEIARRMEGLGAQYSALSDFTYAGGDLSSLPSVFPDALALAARTVMEPTFPEGEFQRVKTETLANIAQKLARVEGIAPDVFNRAIYDPVSPYARPAEGTPQTVTALTRGDVVEWHRKMFSPGATTVLIVGDLTPGQARAAVERAFGTWKATTQPRPSVSTRTRPTAGTRVILVDRPGSVQSGIVVGERAVPPTDPDYLKLVALNRLLGGGFNARLNMNLREKHGYTYGAFSQLAARRGASSLWGGSAVRTNVTDSSVIEAVKEYRGLISGQVPADEFGGAVNNVVASFPNSIQTTQGLASRMMDLLTRQLPLDYYATYREKLAALTPAEVHAAARKVLDPDALTIVVVGDLAKVEAPIRQLNLGTVEVWVAEGKKLR